MPVRCSNSSGPKFASMTAFECGRAGCPPAAGGHGPDRRRGAPVNETPHRANRPYRQNNGATSPGGYARPGGESAQASCRRSRVPLGYRWLTSMSWRRRVSSGSCESSRGVIECVQFCGLSNTRTRPVDSCALYLPYMPGEFIRFIFSLLEKYSERHSHLVKRTFKTSVAGPIMPPQRRPGSSPPACPPGAARAPAPHCA